MATRYSRQHYEDVARLIRESWPIEDDSREVEEVILFSLTNRFADLFAADNPRHCRFCLVPEEGDGKDKPHANGAEHDFAIGFDREQFLTACGLKAEEKRGA